MSESPHKDPKAPAQSWIQSLSSGAYANIMRAAKYVIGEGAGYFDLVSEKRRINKAKDLITDSVTQELLKEIKARSPLGMRLLAKEMPSILREQSNLDATWSIAMDHIEASVSHRLPSPDPIDDDWLIQFRRAASAFSSEEMQYGFARILAGEINNPGSFSPLTLQRFSLLNKKAAGLLHTFSNCAIRASDSAPVVPYLGNQTDFSVIEKFGLSYDSVAYLQEYGLVQPEVNAYQKLSEIDLKLFTIGRVPFTLVHDEDVISIEIHGAMLTEAGTQIASVLDNEPHEEFIAEVVSYMSQRGIRLKRITQVDSTPPEGTK